MIPLIRGELTVRLPVSALRSSAPGGRVSPSSNRISSNSVSRAYFNPRDSAGDREVISAHPFSSCFQGPRWGSTHLSVTRVPRITMRKVEAIMKYQLAVAFTWY